MRTRSPETGSEPKPPRPPRPPQPDQAARRRIDALAGSARRVAASSSFRLTVLYMLLLSASVAVLLAFLYWSTAGYMDRQTDATIKAESQGLAE